MKKKYSWGDLFDSAIELFHKKEEFEIKYIGNIQVTKLLHSRNELVGIIKDYNQNIKIKVRFSSIDDTSKSKIVQEILKYPSVTEEILKSNYPVEIVEIIKKLKINIFQGNWTNNNLQCTCKEWLMPCSHTVAFFKYLKIKLDKKPELIFKLIEFDILEDVKLAVVSRKIVEIKIPKIDYFLTESTPLKKDFYNYDLLKNIDFTVFSDIKSSVLSILDRNPVFHHVDFKSVLYSAYQDISLGTKFYANNFYNKDLDTETKLFVSNVKRVEIVMSIDLNIKTINYYNQKEEIIIAKKNDLHFLMKILEALPEKKLLTYSPYIIALYYIYLFSVEALLNSAYIPQIIEVTDNSYKIRWIPKILSQEVNQLFRILQEILPENTIIVTDEKSKNQKYFNNNELAFSLCSLFLEHFISIYVDQIINIQSLVKTDNVFRLFFKKQIVKFSRISDKNTPFFIYDWLKKFYLTQKSHSLAVKIKENDNIYNIELAVNDKTNLAEIELEKIFLENDYQKIKSSILKDLELIIEYIPEFEFFKNINNKILNLNSDQFVDFLIQKIPVLRLFGISIELPEALNNIIKPQITIELKKKNKGKFEKYVDLDKILDFDWKIAIGNKFIDEKEFSDLVKNMSGIVKINDSFVWIKKEDITKLKNQIAAKQQITSYEIAKAILSEEYKDAKVSISKDVRKIIEQLKNTQNFDLPKGLNAELRPYQKRGYEWLLKNSKFGLGSLIADDMGLGKTIQVLSALLKIKEDGDLKSKKVLVVVPTTLLTNWRKEIEKFTPDLTFFTYWGSTRKAAFEGADIILTSYGTVRSDINNLKQHNWFAVIIDEAQNIKNSTTDQAKSIKQLSSDLRIAMSGTPVENRLTEYWSILDFLNQGIFGTQKQFVDEFATPIQLYRSKSKLEKFKKITQPLILRRLKSDKSIINDLPDKVESNQYCHLTKEQTALYQTVISNTLELIATAEKKDRSGLIFKMIISLKQICNHPYHFLKKGDLSFDISGKVTMLFNILETIYENNEKVLIFTQYKEMGDILVSLIEKHFQVPVLFLNGSLSKNQRDVVIDTFQTQSNYQTFVLSLKAGGLGLNLTEANNVIHFDLWWNPATEAQATDRAYRIGQLKNVMVYRLICKGTFEEKINEMLNSKKELAELSVVTGEKWVGDISEKDIKEIFELR